MDKALKCYDGMMQADRKLYDLALTTTGFAYWFNAIGRELRITEDQANRLTSENAALRQTLEKVLSIAQSRDDCEDAKSLYDELASIESVCEESLSEYRQE